VIQAGAEYYEVACLGFRKVVSRRVSVEHKRKARAIVLGALEEFGSSCWEGGYIPEGVTLGCAPLQAAAQVVGLPGAIGVLWNFCDRWGFGGDSDLCYLQWMMEGSARDGPVRRVVGVWSLPKPYREYRRDGRMLHAKGKARDFVDALVHIRRGRVAPDRYLDAWPHQQDHNLAEKYAPDEELD